ncbi:MAG TPA: TlpA disulfide reductase family protein [Gemmatimonadales bacterium]|nr:TlpA disulfide reductase family protein [Gemmatimonadales bacterium]
MRTPLAAAGLAVLACAPALAQQDEIGLPLGSTPAAVQVQTLDGQSADLSQFVGRRPVIIQFWAHWCSLCEALKQDMIAAQRRYGREVEFILIGVAVNQSRERMRRHFEREPMPFRLYYDATGAAVRAYEAPGTSYVVALDASGRVRYTGIGDEQDVDLAARRALGR